MEKRRFDHISADSGGANDAGSPPSDNIIRRTPLFLSPSAPPSSPPLQPQPKPPAARYAHRPQTARKSTGGRTRSGPSKPPNAPPPPIISFKPSSDDIIRFLSDQGSLSGDYVKAILDSEDDAAKDGLVAALERFPVLAPDLNWARATITEAVFDEAQRRAKEQRR